MLPFCLLLAAALAAALAWTGWQCRAGRAREAAQLLEWGAERDRLRQAAEETEEHLSAILASMEEGVMVVDTSHVIRLANPSLQRIFAFKTAPVGQTVLGALRLPQLERLLREAVESQQPQEQEMEAALVPGQSPSHFIVSAVPMRGAEGVMGGIAVFRDVSRLRKLEELRREFVANVSHELRTPLSIFQGHVEILLDQAEYPPEEVRPILKVMRKHSSRLNALVEDLLTLTRLESRRDPLKREILHLAAFLGDLATEWQAKVAPKEVHLMAEVAAGTPPLPADPHRLRQVLDNLLDNALKYTPNQGKIAVRARAHGGRIEIRVEDSGSGIPPSALPHIFERFYRADKARSRELGGTGLGLSIVKHIVQTHGGTVAAESTCGRGTTIILDFPEAVEENGNHHGPRVEAH